MGESGAETSRKQNDVPHVRRLSGGRPGWRRVERGTANELPIPNMWRRLHEQGEEGEKRHSQHTCDGR